MEKEKAKAEWKAYCEVVKTHDEPIYEDLKKVFYQLSKGRQIIDIYDSFKQAGKNDNDEPKLAICRANLKEVVFERRDNGGGAFYGNYDPWGSNYAHVALPEDTFDNWNWPKGYMNRRQYEAIKTIVPIIPAKYIPNGQLHRYFILWEVEEWKPTPPKDPLLLRRLTKNLFAIMAAWDLTEIERAVIRGAIA